MPIKLPRGFARRKSSGNALGDVDGPPGSSFRVIERPGSESRFPDRGNALKTVSNGRLLGTPTEDLDNIFSGIEKPLPKNRYADHQLAEWLNANRGQGQRRDRQLCQLGRLVRQFIVRTPQLLVDTAFFDRCHTGPCRCLEDLSRYPTPARTLDLFFAVSEPDLFLRQDAGESLDASDRGILSHRSEGTSNDGEFREHGDTASTVRLRFPSQWRG
jgi:hypothetical protein